MKIHSIYIFEGYRLTLSALRVITILTIKSFPDKETEKIFNRQFSSKLPQNIQRIARKNLKL